MANINKITVNGTTYDIEDSIARSGTGLTDDIKQALLDCFEHVAWIDEHGQDYYDALEEALYPPANLVSISCVYTQSGTVYDTDTLDSLKSDLVVTAQWDDNTTSTVTTYTLSGTLTTGTSTITVSYGGKTTTFDVTVTEAPGELWIEQLGVSGSVANFNFSPFVLPTDTYSYDYSKSITAIEADFTSAGVVSVGYCSVGSPQSSETYDSSTVVVVETLTVDSTGEHKLDLTTPMQIPNGFSLVIGRSTDSAKFNYGGTLTNGFAYKDSTIWKRQSKKLGVNVYRR